MSNINVLLVKDEGVRFANVHYRTIMKLLESNSCPQLINSFFLDAGYIIVDWNKKTIISNQSGFPIGKIAGKNWFVVEV